MELGRLLEGIEVLACNTDKTRDIKGIKISSGEVGENEIFVCMEGISDDGNRHIGEISVPFVAITEKEPPEGVDCVLVKDARKAYSMLSQNWFSRPLEGMKFVAVVGTNGKTSTAHYVSSMLTFAGMKTGLIGTEGHYICGERVGESLTTPDPFELNELLFRMRTRGVDVVISEVSAHAIYLEKLWGMQSDVALLTNITQDHLDYFKNFDNYCNVKMSYFTSENTKKAIINADDASGALLMDRLSQSGLEYVSYGLKNPADAFGIDVAEDIDGLRFVANICDDIIPVRSSLYGDFNVYNLLLALTACRELGVDAETLARAVRRVKTVKGRFTILKNDRGTVIIDYAHTPDGLKNLLSTARTLTKSRLVTVFGCGGDRDKSKRGRMGEIASRYSDFVIVTSDNPRYENPESIMHDIEWGLTGDKYKLIADRNEAIRYAMDEMLEGDTVVVAGKGNESYLEIKGRRVPYSDFDAVARWGQAR